VARSAASTVISLFELIGYQQHPLHAADRAYTETNCYTDVLIELLSCAGHEPLAMLGPVLAADFEGDQWTFFKPEPAELRTLYGVDVHEMQPSDRLPCQIARQLSAGRTVIVELDAWYLPDTAATSYRREHVKTSVIAAGIDVEGQRLRYFHNAGLYELDGADFRGAFRIEPTGGPDVLPPYTELVRFDAGPALSGEALRATALQLLPGHLGRRPTTNPFERFAEQFATDLPALLDGSAEDFHSYAFANIRMAGAAFELAASHVRWLFGHTDAPGVQAFDVIVEASKALSFRLARRRPFQVRDALAEPIAAWDRAMADLDSALGR
jgi:hypothetical protein